MEKDKKEVFVISRVTKGLKEEFYKKCRKAGQKPSDKLRDLIQKFINK